MKDKKKMMKKKKSSEERQDALFSIAGCEWYCRPSSFTVKGKSADENDFGEQYDRDLSNVERWSCADMHFTPKPAIDAVLKKYSLTVGEYNEICEALEEKLSFGCCSLCV